MMTYPAGTLFGRFTLDKNLSITRMAEVYLAYERDRYDESKKKYPAVIKINTPDDIDANLHAMQKEVNILKDIHHPGIVRILPLKEHQGKMRYVLFESNERCYFALEYINGGNLEDQLRAIHSGRFDLLWRIELLYQIVTVVHYLHYMGYAHLDLKPENILFRYPIDRSESPIPVLIDFGSASFIDMLDNDITATRRYAPPELLEAIDRPDLPEFKKRVLPDKADVWSLGAIMFEILTSHPLVPGRSNLQLSTTIRERNFKNISDINPTVPEILNKLLGHMIQEEPARRIGTEDILEALQEIIIDIQPPRLSRY